MMYRQRAYVVLAGREGHQELAGVNIGKVVDSILGIVVVVRVGVQLRNDLHVAHENVFPPCEFRRAGQ